MTVIEFATERGRSIGDVHIAKLKFSISAAISGKKWAERLVANPISI